MPVVVSIVVVSLLWQFIYSPGDGLLNNILTGLTFGAFEPKDWLGSSSTALGSIMAMSIWQGVGFQMVIYLAGLQSIPESLYEAAKIDGATNWDRFRYVTIPQLRNTTIFVVLSTTILAFALFDQVEIMTEGGPQDATQTMILRLISFGFRQGQVGLGSALGVFYFLLVMVVAFAQRRLLREERAVD